MIRELERLFDECPKLKILTNRQLDKGLNDELWEDVTKSFILAGRISLAKKFNRLFCLDNIKKADCDKKKRREVINQRALIIDDLSIKKDIPSIRCVLFGCKREDIEECWEEVRYNAKNEIINHVSSALKLLPDEKRTIGINYKNNSKDDNNELSNKWINGNRYAVHVLRNYDLMHHESERFYIYLRNHWQALSANKMRRLMRNFFHRFEPYSWTTGIETAYMNTLKLECPEQDELFPPENYINVKNGLLDLRTLTIIPHSKQYFTTNQIPVEYNPKTPAKCPEFKKFLGEVFQYKNKPDKELIDLVQEIMGYCLSYGVQAHKMFLFVGEGSNGKSVLCNIMFKLAGGAKNVSSVAMGDFEKTFARAQIVDKTLNISTENEMQKNLDTQVLKAIVSGDPIQVEEKFKSPFTYRPTVKLIFSMNNMPSTKDTSYGYQRRLIAIPFNSKFVDKPVHKEEKLIMPDKENLLLNELDGIFAFAIEGLRRLAKNKYKFTKSLQSEKLLTSYQEQINPYMDFFDDRITVSKDNYVVKKDAFEAYARWCKKNKHPLPLSSKLRTFTSSITKILQGKGIPFDDKYKGNRAWRGIYLKEE